MYSQINDIVNGYLLFIAHVSESLHTFDFSKKLFVWTLTSPYFDNFREQAYF